MVLNGVSAELKDMKYSSFMEVVLFDDLMHTEIEIIPQIKTEEIKDFDKIIEVVFVDGDMAFYFKDEKLKYYKEL